MTSYGQHQPRKATTQPPGETGDSISGSLSPAQHREEPVLLQSPLQPAQRFTVTAREQVADFRAGTWYQEFRYLSIFQIKKV